MPLAPPPRRDRHIVSGNGLHTPPTTRSPSGSIEKNLSHRGSGGSAGSGSCSSGGASKGGEMPETTTGCRAGSSTQYSVFVPVCSLRLP